MADLSDRLAVELLRAEFAYPDLEALFDAPNVEALANWASGINDDSDLDRRCFAPCGAVAHEQNLDLMLLVQPQAPVLTEEFGAYLQAEYRCNE